MKSLGEIDSPTRTAEQTEIGIFWALRPPGAGHAAFAVQPDRAGHRRTGGQHRRRERAAVRADEHRSGRRGHRTLGLQVHRRSLASRDRDPARRRRRQPEHRSAIQLGAAGRAGHGRTIPNFTPPFPAYVSGHATFGAAAFEVLAQFYGTDNMNFTLPSDELPGVTRSYTSFRQASAENARSRIYLGIHWNFDDSEGRICGVNVGDWVFDHVAQPVGSVDEPIGNGNFELASSMKTPVFGDRPVTAPPRMIDAISDTGQTEDLA